MIELVSGIIGLILLILKERTPRREKTYENDLQKMDQAIVDGDGDYIAKLFERVRREAGGNPGRPDGNALIG